MSDGISLLIEQIGDRAKHFHQQLVAERSKNEQLSNELEKLKSELSQRDSMIEQLNSEIASLRKEINTIKDHTINSSVRKQMTDDEIDDLVKEIDYCLEQLKQ